jgi:hypothetical protein
LSSLTEIWSIPFCFCGRFGDGFLRAGDAAELVVVDQPGDRGVIAADRALRVAAQLEFAEAHRECVGQQQATDERLADAENQLDDLCRLHDAEQAGQDAEHAALGA